MTAPPKKLTVDSPHISRRVTQISISATKEMPILAAKVGGCVSMGQGIPSFATPEYIVKAVCGALETKAGIGKYSLQTGMPALRRALSVHLKKEKGIVADPETQIMITVGAMEALLSAVLTLVDKDDEVIVPSPAYGSHIEQILLAEGKPVFVPLRKRDWGLDVDKIEKSGQRTHPGPDIVQSGQPDRHRFFRRRGARRLPPGGGKRLYDHLR